MQMILILDVTDPASKWRDIVDLLCFPTGGGKTEAYLGVAAYTFSIADLLKVNLAKA